MGSASKAVTSQVSDPSKLAANVATGGMYGQVDAPLKTVTGSGLTNPFAKIGGSAPHVSQDQGNAGVQAPNYIDSNKYANAAPTVAPQAQAFTAAPTSIATGQSDQSRSYQNFLNNQLMAQTQGQGPSLAQGQFQQNLDQSIAAQQALAASARGGNIAGAQRQAAMNTGNLNLQGAQQAAQLRQQEQLNAQGLLSQTAGTQRSQDIGLATSQAGLTQQGNIFNAQQQQQGSQFNANQQAQLNDLRGKYMAMGLSADQANLQAQNNLNQANLEQAKIRTGIASGNLASDNARTGQILGTLGTVGAAGVGAMTGGASTAAGAAGGGLGVAPDNAMSVQESSGLLPANPDAGFAQPTAGQSAGMDFGNAMNPTGQPAATGLVAPSPLYPQPTTNRPSDKNLKKDIKEGGKDMQTFLNEVSPYTYAYKDAKFGSGPQTSVMAQDLEKSKLGKTLVTEGAEGKMVDYGKGLATMLAATAHLNQRLKEIEANQKAAKVAKVMKKGGK